MPSTMRAAVAADLGIIRCEEVRIPTIAENDVLVRTIAASICGSDLHMLDTGWAMHAFPAMAGHPGHEAVGEVVQSLRLVLLKAMLSLLPRIYGTHAVSLNTRL